MQCLKILLPGLLSASAFGASAARISPRNRSSRSGVVFADIGAWGGATSVDLQLQLERRPKIKTKFKSKGRARGPTNTRGDNSDRDVRERNITIIKKCDDAFAAPDKGVVQCPEECPLMRFHPEKLCHWRCISEEKCASYPGVVNRDEGYCYVCKVPGCKRCASDEQVCRECHRGFRLEDGQCISRGFWKWMILLAVLAFFGLIAVAYTVHLAWRPVVSEGAMNWGLEHRSKSKARDDIGNHKLYDLNLSLADTVTAAGGVGAALHFSWQRIVLLWSLAVTLSFMAVVGYHGRLRIRDMTRLSPMHDEAEGVCTTRLDPLAEDEFEAMRIDILWLTGVVYVGSSVGAIYWAWWQRRKFIAHEDGTTDMRDYALSCLGFPQEKEDERGKAATGKLEEEYTQYFKSAWGESVIGVSIAWNMDGKEHEVKDAVGRIVIDLETQLQDKVSDDSGDGAGSSAASTPRSRSALRTPAVSRRHSRAQCFCGPVLEAVDGLWWGEIPECMHSHSEEAPEGLEPEEEARELLNELPTSGSCFVILRTERDMNACLEKPLPKFRGKHDITVFEAAGGAETVLWDGFTATDEERRWFMFIGIVQVLCIVGIWTLCFWGPYTLYILSWGDVAGASQGDASIGLVVGMLITVGNQIVYAACGWISEQIKFTHRELRDTYYTGLYTFAVLVNTILDMWLVTIMATGWRRDAAADPQALVRNPSMQHALFIQLIFYLWPCTLLLPFMLEPFVLNVGPYFLAKWLVRSRPNCTKLDAEECLVPPPFDLNRYGDNLINIMMVCIFFLLTGVTIWWIFAMLTISLWVVYCWDCYRFKRGTMRTHFATEDIDVLANYIMAIPCAILASGFIFKARGGQGMVMSWDPDNFLGESHAEIWIEVSLGFFLHLVLHFLIVAFVVPRFLPSPDRGEKVAVIDGRDVARDLIPYEATAEGVCCNWFNSNPVHCLRSRYIYLHEPSHVFYQPGREYLHRKNERPQDQDAFIIYESEVFMEETDIFQDMKFASQSMIGGAGDLVRGTSKRLGRLTSSDDSEGAA